MISDKLKAIAGIKDQDEEEKKRALRDLGNQMVNEEIAKRYGVSRLVELNHTQQLAIGAIESFLAMVEANCRKHGMRFEHVIGFIASQLVVHLEQDNSEELKQGLREGREVFDLTEEISRKVGLATVAEVKDRIDQGEQLDLEEVILSKAQ